MLTYLDETSYDVKGSIKCVRLVNKNAELATLKAEVEDYVQDVIMKLGEEFKILDLIYEQPNLDDFDARLKDLEHLSKVELEGIKKAYEPAIQIIGL
jgi:hypothetical protein